MNIQQLILSLAICLPAQCLCIASSNETAQLKSIMKPYNFARPETKADFINFRNNDFYLQYQLNSRKVFFNNVLIWLSTPITKEKSKWIINQTDFACTIEPLLQPANALAKYKPRLVVIDPGHGGSNIGAIGANKTHEKKIVLDIAKRVEAKLIKAGVSVKLTRPDDHFLQLEERVAMASEWNADLFVSIHINFAGNKLAEGIETYVTSCAGFSSTSSETVDQDTYRGNKFDKANIALAYFTHKELLDLTSAADRGIRHARFTVIRDANCPAILVECGFLSNANEEERLITPEYRDKLAEGISRGAMEYIQHCGQ